MTRTQIASVIAQTVAEVPSGAPSGPMYAALMGEIDLQTYEEIVGALKHAGLITEQGHTLYPTERLLNVANAVAATS